MDSNSKSTKKKKNGTKMEKHADEIKDKISVGSKQLPVKLFEHRESVLTELFENKHLVSIYHIFMALFIGICINTLLHDYLYNGKIRLGYNLVSKGFRNIHIMALIWIFMFCLSLVPYFGVKLWTRGRSSLKNNSLQMYFWDRIGLICYITYLFVMLYTGTALLINADLGFASGMASISESLRLIMKVYSFGRVCISRVLNQPEKYYKQHPKLSQYIYFSFAPTLLYRDSYPRLSGKVRWGYVTVCFLEFGASLLFLSMMFDRAFIPPLEHYGIKHISFQEIVMVMVNNAPYGLLVMLLVNYLVLHVWLNAFSEMLRFSDRLFYKDWWTSPTYERYYRTWNTVVHDWLYEYVYKDFFEIVLPKRKMIGKVAVFFLSSLFHDYAVSISIGFCLPIFFLQFFIIGELVAYVRFPNNFMGNVFLLYSLGLGCSMMLTLYTLEYYARANCAGSDGTTLDYFLPKLVACYK